MTGWALHARAVLQRATRREALELPVLEYTSNTDATTAGAGSETPEASTEPLSPTKVARTIQSAARKAAGSFYGYVPFEDMLQQAHLVTLEHPRKFQRFVDDGDAKRLWGMVYKSCSLYGQKIKAASLGYRMEDLYFYSLKTLRRVLPLVLEGLETPESYTESDAFMDITSALESLSGAEWQLIWWAFHGDPDEEAGYANVAAHLALTDSAARGRVDRVLRRLQELLGGENPSPRRPHRTSNASAIAETRNAWDGEG